MSDDPLPQSWSKEDGFAFSGHDVEAARTAHSKLYLLCAKPLCELLEKQCRGNPFNEEDVGSEAFRRAFRGRQTFRPTEDPFKWLYAIAKNTLTDMIRNALDGPRLYFRHPESMALKRLRADQRFRIKHYAFHGGDRSACEMILSALSDDDREVLDCLLRRSDQARTEHQLRLTNRAPSDIATHFRELIAGLAEQHRTAIERTVFRGVIDEPGFDAAIKQIPPEDIMPFQWWINHSVKRWHELSAGLQDDLDRFIVEQMMLTSDDRNWAHKLANQLVPIVESTLSAQRQPPSTTHDLPDISESLSVPSSIATEPERQNHVKRIAATLRQRWHRLRMRIKNDTTAASNREGDSNATNP